MNPGDEHYVSDIESTLSEFFNYNTNTSTPQLYDKCVPITETMPSAPALSDHTVHKFSQVENVSQSAPCDRQGTQLYDPFEPTVSPASKAQYFYSNPESKVTVQFHTNECSSEIRENTTEQQRTEVWIQKRIPMKGKLKTGVLPLNKEKEKQTGSTSTGKLWLPLVEEYNSSGDSRSDSKQKLPTINQDETHSSGNLLFNL